MKSPGNRRAFFIFIFTQSQPVIHSCRKYGAGKSELYLVKVMKSKIWFLSCSSIRTFNWKRTKNLEQVLLNPIPGKPAFCFLQKGAFFAHGRTRTGFTLQNADR